MIGLDTNVLVRYIAQDDRKQSPLATRLIETECTQEDPGFVSLVVLVELVWVSESCYDATRAQIAEILEKILSARQLVVQDAEIAWQALRIFESSKADFADCLAVRLATAAGCDSIATFDRAAARAGMTLVK